MITIHEIPASTFNLKTDCEYILMHVLNSLSVAFGVQVRKLCKKKISAFEIRLVKFKYIEYILSRERDNHAVQLNLEAPLTQVGEPIDAEHYATTCLS